MLLPLIPDALHLLSDVLEPLEHIDQLLARDDQKRALDLSNSRAVPLVPLILCAFLVRVREYVRVAEVRALHIQVERDVHRLTLSSFIQVYVKFDSALEDEKNFFCIVTLLVESILGVDFHGL